MKEDGKKCWSCFHFRAYYTSGYCCLRKEDNGYCERQKKVMQRTDGCDQWHSRYTSKELRLRIARESIPAIYKKIAAIEEILREEMALQKIRNK